ncbi:hypothetical protein SLINC_7919 [Streptomyces lincolnensis]|uniref:Uncharacterized protein n=1 Tax=Streptomyces lincolnensis TaxID=1915 RepID=A0A1B1MNL7_STRLN|nr:hypothetical protein [Streptomyces lincolnensis]ANS70143.1 hypothetical protein SLINC_7919 [Streptomyces lincolnensis]AXG59040.1 hypothetical protein SLCG_7885 [Streptomyces lincolnensis]QMV11634.1 hypothetical protein GJU35_42130 [Streptomyces lincolnensis]
MTMKHGRTKGAQVGDGNVQHNTYLPPQRTPQHRSRDYAPSATVTAGDHSTVTQKNTHLRFSIPVIGPLLAVASTHPVIAGAAAVAIIGGGGLATTTALSDPDPSVSTTLVRGFRMKATDQGAPTGYDFSRTPPVVAGANTDAIYVSGGYMIATDGRLAEWTSSKLPSAAECRTAVAENPVRQTVAGSQRLVCFVDRNGKPGYILVTGTDGQYTSVDTAHLR